MAASDPTIQHPAAGTHFAPGEKISADGTKGDTWSLLENGVEIDHGAVTKNGDNWTASITAPGQAGRYTLRITGTGGHTDVVIHVSAPDPV